MTQHHRSIRLFVGLVATATLAVGLLAAPASAATKGEVKGVVTLDGKPLRGATVTLQRTDDGDEYDKYKSVKTSGAGAYSFSSRPDSSTYLYRILVTDSQHRAVTTVRDFNNKSKTVTRNVTMKPAGSITGKITRANGSAATNTQVHIVGPQVIINPEMVNPLAYNDYATANSSGTYRFVGLPAGKYTIQYEDLGNTYLSECFDDVLADWRQSEQCASGSGNVTVTPSVTTTVKAQQLNHPGGRLRGTVTDTSGKAISDVSVYAVSAGPGPQQDFNNYGPRSNGQFTAAPIPSGNWRLQVDDLNGIWETKWFNSSTKSGARVFAIAEGTVVKDLTVKLKSRAKISAKVTPGTRRASFTINVVRKATGGHPGGRVSVSLGDITKTVKLKKGSAKVTLTKLPAGKQKFRVEYRGNSSTAKVHKTVSVKVG